MVLGSGSSFQSLLDSLLILDPQKRINSQEALNHPCIRISDKKIPPKAPSSSRSSVLDVSWIYRAPTIDHVFSEACRGGLVIPIPEEQLELYKHLNGSLSNQQNSLSIPVDESIWSGKKHRHSWKMIDSPMPSLASPPSLNIDSAEIADS